MLHGILKQITRKRNVLGCYYKDYYNKNIVEIWLVYKYCIKIKKYSFSQVCSTSTLIAMHSSLAQQSRLLVFSQIRKVTNLPGINFKATYPPIVQTVRDYFVVGGNTRRARIETFPSTSDG